MICWTTHLTGEPKGGSNVAVTVGDKVYYFDGNTAQNDVDVLNTVSLCWRTSPLVTTGRERHPELSSRRQDHTAVLIEDIIYIWGGCKSLWCEFYNVLLAFDVDTHRWLKPRVSGSVPKGRVDHSACVLGKVMFIHGGSFELSRWTNDTYKLDTSTMVWSLINTRGTPPPASGSHSATIIGTKMFVFGGMGQGSSSYNAIRVFDTETNCWLDTPSAQLLPERLRDHSAFAYKGELYIFGGRNWDQTFSDLWKFNPESFSWKKVEPKGKGPSEMYNMCCCVVGDQIFLFGGIKTADDLYLLDLSPSLKTLCKLAVIQYGLEQSGLPHNIRWELAAMTTNRN